MCFVIIYWTWFIISIPFCDTTCTFPPLWDSGWTDSVLGDLTFDSSTSVLSGWRIRSYASTLTSWTCVADDTSNNYLLFLANQKIDLFGNQNNALRCIKWKKITDNSYYYYALNNIENNAEQTRLYVEQYHSSVTTWDPASYCNPTSGPGPEEYHILLRQGYALSSRQWCPNLLLASLSYVHDDGISTTCGTNSNFTACPSWTTVHVDYSACPTVQAYSQEGMVYCMNTVEEGNTFHTVVYNPGTVDDVNYYRFTCYTLEGNTTIVYASDNPKICAVGQTATSKTTDGGTVVMAPRDSCYGSCVLPDTWDGLWYDSGMGDIEIRRADSAIVSGWDITVNGQQLDSWTCQSQDTTRNLILFKADKFVEVADVKYNVFRCMQWTKLTNYSYIYYVLNDIDTSAGNERIYKELYDPTVNSWDTASYCSPASGPPVERYHTLVKQGYISEVKQWCPVPLLANFTYTHNDGTTTTCSGGSGLSVCPSWTTLTFDYNKCSTVQAFSQEGLAHCVHFVQSGNTFYTSVINPGFVDETNFYRFTCLTVTASTPDTVLVSDSAGICEEGQRSDAKQVDGSGVLTLTLDESCHGSCTMPSNLNSTWHDSDFGHMTFDNANSKITDGWQMTVFNTTVSKWTCQSENTTSNYMLFKSDDIVEEGGIKYNVFRCIQWRNITRYSYRYYILNDFEGNAGNVRVFLEEYDPTVNNWPTSHYCSPSSGPGVEEYNMLVKQGHETDVKQWCPIPLRGTFSYIHNDGISNTCGTGTSGLSLCPTWSTMTFNYSLCSTVQAFSQEGIVYCIHTVESGDTYFTTVLNPGSVDGVNHHRFTCYAFNQSGSIIYASDSAGGCARGQSPKSKEPDGSGTLIFSSIASCYGSCSLPSAWTSSWHDSGMADVTFSGSGLTGWDVNAFGDTVQSWTCQSQSNNFYLFKGDVEVDTENTPQNVFLCVQITQISDYSLMYYPLASKNSDAGNVRVYVESHDPEVTSWDIPGYCNMSYKPGAGEYHMLVKKGYESDVKQWCPVPLRGNFTYVHDNGATQTCSGNSDLSVCPSWTSMTFDYTKCNTVQAYSQEGIAYCIQTVLSGTTYYTAVINPGFVDDTTFYRFTCYAMSENGTAVYVSDSRGICEEGQSPTTKEADGSGTLTLTATNKCYGSCIFPNAWDGDWYDSFHGDIVLNNGTSTISSGWTINTHNASLTSWTCVADDPTNNVFLFLSNEYVRDSSGKRQNVFICMKWNRVTDNSYTYYIKNDVGTDTSQRLFMEDYDPSITSWTTSSYCTPSSPPSNEEFHMLVKKGAESQVKQWCPYPLRSSFSYIHNDGTTDRCTADSDLNVCPSWTTMKFNYTRCPTVQAFSQEGIVDCVYTLSSASVFYTMVLNTGFVDHVTYHRFTCLAISEVGTTVVMSDSAGSCERGQTPTAKASDGSGTLTMMPKTTCRGSCSFPDFWNSTWYDSQHGDIEMSSTEATISGWTYTVSGSTLSSWTCQSNTSQNNLLLFLADKQIELSGITYNVFKCILWKRLTDYSYSYYVYNDIQPTAGGSRLSIEEHDPYVTSWSIATYCSPTSPPSIEEYHVLVKQGHESEVKQWCPPPLVGSFTYEHKSGSVVTCSSDSDLDICNDWTTMTFDYSKCSTMQAFSQEGEVYCVNTVQNGSAYYTTVLNPGMVDYSATFRFTCMAISQSGSELLVSDSSGSCRRLQQPTVEQSDGSGVLTVSQSESCYGNCSFPYEWNGTWMDSGYGDVEMDRSRHKITSGWIIEVYNVSLSTWTCHSENTSDGRGLQLFKADSIVENDGIRYNIFRCIQWYRISNVSYYYYVMEDINPSGNNERIHIEEHDPLVFSWDVNKYCNPTSGPSPEEYHVLVKKGKESEAKQWCPLPLRGSHSYTFQTGSNSSCTSNSNLNVCPDWSTMSFNYSLCQTEQAFSAEGIVYCVHTIKTGATYFTTLLNPGIVDGVNYHRFSCYAISSRGNQVNMSDSAGSCEVGQSPTVQQSDGSGTLILTTNSLCHGTCTLPAAWDGTWFDSGEDEIEFDQSTNAVTSGWIITSYSSSVTSWTCVSQDDARNYLLFLGDQPVNFFGLSYNAFKCISWKKLTDYSYSYYVRANMETNAGSKRVFIQLYDATVTSWNTSDYCNPTNGPGLEEYHVIVKQGYESQARQWCPIPLLGTFSYVHNDGTTDTCGAGSVLDVCDTWTTLTFNYTQCATKQAFSDGGVVYCVNTVTSGDIYYTTVVNPEGVDYSSNYKFTCLAMSRSGSTVRISDSVRTCQPGQRPDTKQTDGSGTLVLTPYSTCYGSCAFPSLWNDTWYDSGMGDITMSQSDHTITTGWSVMAFGANISSWTCLSENVTENLMLFKGNVTPEYNGVQQNVFRCIKWTRLTNYSFTYYVYNDVNANASNDRVYTEELDPSSISFDVYKYCTPSSPPGMEEFQMLVKEGWEDTVVQWCPIPLLGRFSYEHNDGTTTTCGSGSEVNTCSDWTTLRYDYSKCSTEQAFSVEGIVSCVHTVTIGDTYFTSLLNPGTVDAAHSRFSCYSMRQSGNSLLISDSRGSCEAGQAPEVKQSDGSGTMAYTPYETCYGDCSFPSTWNSTWYDSSMGDIEISSDKHAVTSGWTINVYGTDITSWTCQTNDTADFILFKGDNLIQIGGEKYNVFRCIQWMKITDNSYRYYILNDPETNAGGHRLLVERHDPGVNFWNISSYCSPSSPPSSEEYHVLVRKGYESDVKQWCPIPLLGTFSYVFNDGSSDKCSASSELTLCPLWTTLQFDYSKCSETQIFSQEGQGYCVDTVLSGGTEYTTVLNPGTVDHNDYHRFTCLAISKVGGILTVSDSKGSCQPGQVSTVKQSDGSGTLTLTQIYGNCTFPSEWDSTWYDSRAGDVTMGVSTHDVSSGWSFTVFGSNVSSFTCQSEETDNNIFLFKSDDLVEKAGVLYNVFLCMKWTRITDFSYYYYMWQDTSADAAGERVYVELHDPDVSQWNVTSYCTPSSLPPPERFHTLVKQGHDNDVKQWCPNALLGTFYYTHDDGVNQTCGNGSVWEVCPSWTTITFNYTQCPTVQAFSQEGKVYCVFTLLLGSTYYTSVYNPGVVDHQDFHRFTCLSVTSDSVSDDVYVSDSQGSCEPGQMSTTKQTDGSGTLVLTPYSLCQGSCLFPIQWESTWYDSGMGQIEIVAPSKSVTSGWIVDAYGQTVDSWTCQAGDTAKNLLLFKSDDTVLHNGQRYNVFRCIKWREITPYSYFYYVQHDTSADAGGERVFLELYDASVTSWDTSVYCNPTSGPPGEEFHTLVKKSFEPRVAQPCPTPLLATFTYTHNDGTSDTCGTDSELQLCPGWTNMVYDYTKCSTTQAFSLEGSVSCVATVYSGDIFFTSVLNTGDITNSAHDRFTCYSIIRNGSTVFMSDDRGSCSDGQTPTDKQTDGSGTLSLTPTSYCHDDGRCTFPSAWDGDWYDSNYGNITMSALMKSVITGWTIQISNTTLTSWSCVTSNNTGDYVLFKSDQLLDYNNTFYYVFRCIRWTKITDYSYYYYVMADEQSVANNERLYFEQYSSTARTWDTSKYCSPSSSPTLGEHHVIFKKGYEREIRLWCPSPLLGKFSYSHDNGAGTVTCSGYSNLDVCTNRTNMVFNTTLCSTPQAFSEEGSVYCINTVQDGSTYFTTVYNPGSLLNSFYDRVSCFAIDKVGTNVHASDSRGSCNKEQNSTSLQTDGTGYLSLIPYDFTTGTVDESTPEVSSAAAIIAGALAGFLVLLALIVGVLILCKKLKEKGQKTSHSDASLGRKTLPSGMPAALTIEMTDKKKPLSLPPIVRPPMHVAPINHETVDLDKPVKPEKPEKTDKPHKHKKKKKHKEKSPRKEHSNQAEKEAKPDTPDIIRGTSSIVIDDYGKANTQDDFSSTPRSLPSISQNAPVSTSFMINKALSQAIDDTQYPR